MKNSASLRVFSTPELLEAIFLSLPLSDLFIRIPLVNRIFHDVIASSHFLQGKLFFSPITGGPSMPNLLLRHVPADKRPCFIDQHNRAFRAHPPGCWTWPDSNDLRPLMLYDSAARKSAFSRWNASWRKMLIVQPPIRELWMATEEEGAVWGVDSEEDWRRLWMLDEEVGMEWQMFRISEAGRGGLAGYRNPDRIDELAMLPAVPWQL